jgi:hypothetical protein
MKRDTEALLDTIREEDFIDFLRNVWGHNRQHCEVLVLHLILILRIVSMYTVCWLIVLTLC